ncbi:MAG: hypothetical protein S4CHLAM20_06650 [Chlamydiia bacterium]|nr:hypothetical protein [Chlamydiia bacterium]
MRLKLRQKGRLQASEWAIFAIITMIILSSFLISHIKTLVIKRINYEFFAVDDK